MIFTISHSHLLDGDFQNQLSLGGLPESSSREERRVLRRLECSFVVEIPELGRRFEGVNLSLAGILFQCEDWVLAGSVFDILLHLPGGTDALALTARAISHTKRGETRAVRARFSDLDSKSLEILSKWMFSRLN